MNELEKIFAGAVAGVAFIGLVWNRLSGRMTRIEEKTVTQELCLERHRRIDETLLRLEVSQKEILVEIRDLPGKINHG